MQKFFSKIIEFKSNKEKNKFSGYASVFNIKDRANDIILPGAFGKNINPLEVKFLWQHDHKEPIGYFQHIEETNLGLYVEACILEETSRGKEALTLLNTGIINSLSIGFEAEDFFYKDTVRYIKKLNSGK
jgi:HK97 family phage prohead protease